MHLSVPSIGFVFVCRKLWVTVVCSPYVVSLGDFAPYSLSMLSSLSCTSPSWVEFLQLSSRMEPSHMSILFYIRIHGLEAVPFEGVFRTQKGNTIRNLGILVIQLKLLVHGTGLILLKPWYWLNLYKN